MVNCGRFVHQRPLEPPRDSGKIEMPRTIDEVLKDTYSTDPKTRKNAARELCPCEVKFNRREVWDRLLELTQDQDSGR